MIGGEKDDVEVVCPVCKEKVVARAKDADAGRVKCSRGHEIAIAKLMDLDRTPKPTG